MNIIEEIATYGEVRNGGCVLTADREGFHLRESRNIFGKHREDLPWNTTAERLQAHWDGFVSNVTRARG